MPLQFTYSEICHYNSCSTLSLPFSTYSRHLGPLSGHIHIHIFWMDQNTPASSLLSLTDVWDSLTCGPHTSASPSIFSYPSGQRPTRWEGQADTAGGARAPDLVNASSIRPLPDASSHGLRSLERLRQQAVRPLSHQRRALFCFALSRGLTPSMPHASGRPSHSLEACPSPGRAIACCTPCNNKRPSPPSLLTSSSRPNSSQLDQPFLIPRTNGCARLLASPWT